MALRGDYKAGEKINRNYFQAGHEQRIAHLKNAGKKTAPLLPEAL
jgi:hypothetical protein